MASADKELEQQLLEAGNKLARPPSSVDELLPLLDQVENCLAKVEQSPTQSMLSALGPSRIALVADELFKHLDVDVKVAVATCISEITRITAPDAPYDDDKMKDVFQLIVSSFEGLADQSSRSYLKRTSILETVAKVRSCVVMLDLECEALIVEMFQHFFKAIRDHHPENIFTSMETIMSLVLEESEDISIELLSPILASVKRGNKEVLPVAQKLGERVLVNCVSKVKPYLIQAVKSLGISVDDYIDIVATICQEMSATVSQGDGAAAEENKVEENKLEGASSNLTAQADKEIATETVSVKQADPENEKPPKPVVSNGQAGEGDLLEDSKSAKKQEDANHADQAKTIDGSNNTGADTLDAQKAVDTESTPGQTMKSGREDESSLKLTENPESSHDETEKEAEKLLENKSQSKDVPGSTCGVGSPATAVSSENQKEIVSQPSSPKPDEGEPNAVVSPSVSESLPGESISKKAGRSKKMETVIEESAPSADDLPKSVPEGPTVSEGKPQKRSGRKGSAPASNSNENKTTTVVDEPKKESGTAGELEAKPSKHSSKKVDTSDNNGDGSSLKLSDDKRQRSRGKAVAEKNVTKGLLKDDDKDKTPSSRGAKRPTKDEHQSEEIPKSDNKRKRAAGKEKATDDEGNGPDLVGKRVKVWWPRDREFYKGVIDSYDSIKKKHKVLYDDGDQELLNLKRQRWEIIEGDTASEGEEVAEERPSPDSSSDMPLKKKVKTNSEQTTKEEKMDISPKKGGGASSSKSRNASAKAGRNPKEVAKVDGKLANDAKKAKKIEDDGGEKTKDHTPKTGGKSADAASKATGKSKTGEVVLSKTSKSKEDDSAMPKTSKSKQDLTKSGKSKLDTPKPSSGAKGKASKSDSKSNVNGTGKSGVNMKETNEEENSTDSGKAQESSKVKSVSFTKGQASELKTGKKRRRGA